VAGATSIEDFSSWTDRTEISVQQQWACKSKERPLRAIVVLY